MSYIVLPPGMRLRIDDVSKWITVIVYNDVGEDCKKKVIKLSPYILSLSQQ